MEEVYTLTLNLQKENSDLTLETLTEEVFSFVIYNLIILDGGFIAVLSSSNMSQALASIDSLINNNYFDRKTGTSWKKNSLNILAVVIVEFVLYNGNLDTLCLVRYSVEDLASGLLFTEEFYNPVRINFFTGNAQIGVEAAFIIIWLGLLFNEIRQMTNGWKIYFK